MEYPPQGQPARARAAHWTTELEQILAVGQLARDDLPHLEPGPGMPSVIQADLQRLKADAALLLPSPPDVPEQAPFRAMPRPVLLRPMAADARPETAEILPEIDVYLRRQFHLVGSMSVLGVDDTPVVAPDKTQDEAKALLAKHSAVLVPFVWSSEQHFQLALRVYRLDKAGAMQSIDLSGAVAPEYAYEALQSVVERTVEALGQTASEGNRRAMLRLRPTLAWLRYVSSARRKIRRSAEADLDPIRLTLALDTLMNSAETMPLASAVAVRLAHRYLPLLDCESLYVRHLKFDPHDGVAAWLYNEKLALETNRAGDGLKLMRHALRACPALGRAHQALAARLAAQGRVAEAAHYAEIATLLLPTNPWTWLALGLQRRRQMLSDGAVDAFRAALAIDDAFLPAFAPLALTLLAAKKTEEACKVSEQQMRLLAGNPDDLLPALAHLPAGERAQRIADLEPAINSVRLHAEVLLQSPKKAEGRQLLGQLLLVLPSDPGLRELAGQVGGIELPPPLVVALTTEPKPKAAAKAEESGSTPRPLADRGASDTGEEAILDRATAERLALLTTADRGGDDDTGEEPAIAAETTAPGVKQPDEEAGDDTGEEPAVAGDDEGVVGAFAAAFDGGDDTGEEPAIRDDRSDDEPPAAARSSAKGGRPERAAGGAKPRAGSEDKGRGAQGAAAADVVLLQDLDISEEEGEDTVPGKHDRRPSAGQTRGAPTGPPALPDDEPAAAPNKAVRSPEAESARPAPAQTSTAEAATPAEAEAEPAPASAERPAGREARGGGRRKSGKRRR